MNIQLTIVVIILLGRMLAVISIDTICLQGIFIPVQPEGHCLSQSSWVKVDRFILLICYMCHERDEKAKSCQSCSLSTGGENGAKRGAEEK